MQLLKLLEDFEDIVSSTLFAFSMVTIFYSVQVPVWPKPSLTSVSNWPDFYVNCQHGVLLERPEACDREHLVEATRSVGFVPLGAGIQYIEKSTDTCLISQICLPVTLSKFKLNGLRKSVWTSISFLEDVSHLIRKASSFLKEVQTLFYPGSLDSDWEPSQTWLCQSIFLRCISQLKNKFVIDVIGMFFFYLHFFTVVLKMVLSIFLGTAIKFDI